MSVKPRIAFVIDALPAVGGGEKTLFTALEIYPQAEVFTLIYNQGEFVNTPVAYRRVITSYLNRLPLARTHHRLFLPLMPSAIEGLDLRPYDIVVSFSYAVAHGVRVNAGARQLAYTYTPMRYAWRDINIDGRPSRRNMIFNLAMKRFRQWDRRAAARVHEFAAISHGIAGRIQAAYQREARVIYPPVEVERFSPGKQRGDYFVTLSRLVPHKRIDLVIEAFAHLNLPLKIIGDGPHRRHLEKHAAANIEFLGYRSEAEVAGLLSQARGFVCAAEEDFGIAIVEAQAAGCPVIAYGGGGALETVIEGETGLLFAEQSARSLIEAVHRFQDSARCFREEAMHENARRFSKIRFKHFFQEFVGTSER